MNRRTRVFALAVLCLLAAAPAAAPAAAKSVLQVPPLFQSTPKPPPPSLVFAYGAWRVDASASAHAQPPARTVRAIRQQIDIVEHLGLKPEVLAFMRSQPVLADGWIGPGDAPPAEYAAGRGVVLHVRRLDPKKPILLYGLLKAYQAQRLPGGFDNADVARLRGEAAARRVWPKTARMLQNNQEFFALSAATYLYGAITREPYTRADLKKTEPLCYQWLANLFDAGRPRG
jgi:hypothetical protein